MKSVSKIIGLLLVGILVLLLVAGLAITQLFDPNDYKDEIRQLVRDKAQLELTLDGEIGWSLFPWLGLEVRDVEVASLERAEQPFAKVRLLAMSVRVLPLLRKEVQMNAIRIDGLNLDLHIDERGVSNWQPEHTTQQTATEAAPEAELAEEQSTAAATSALKFDVSSLIVNSARVDFRDEQSGQRFTLENVQITTGRISEATDINIKLSGFLAGTQPLLRARVELSGLANFDLQRQLFLLKELRMAGELAGELFADKTANFSLRSNLALDLQEQTANISNVRLSVNQLKALADLDVSGLDQQLQFAGKLSLSDLNLKEFLPGIGIAVPATSDSKALTSFSMTAQLRGDENSLALDELSIKLDQSSFAGVMGSKDLAAGQIYVQLQGDQLDADAYLPPATEQPGKVADKTAGSAARVDPIDAPLPPLPGENPWSNEQLLPLDSLRQLTLDVRLGMQELKIKQLPLRKLQVEATANRGVLNLRKLQAQLFAGQLAANGMLDAKTDTPQLEFSGEIADVPLHELVRALELAVPVRGLFSMDASLQARGNSERQLIASLGGKGGFSVADGMLEGINIDRYLCSAIAVLNRDSITQDFSEKNTPFTSMRGNFVIDKGVVNNQSLNLAIPGLQNTGKGRLDLNVMGLDYALGSRLLGDTRQMPDPACRINERYVGLEFPLVCRGSLLTEGALSCKVDGEGLGKIVARLAGGVLTEKLDEKLGEKVSPDLKEALKGLFK